MQENNVFSNSMYNDIGTDNQNNYGTQNNYDYQNDYGMYGNYDDYVPANKNVQGTNNVLNNNYASLNNDIQQNNSIDYNNNTQQQSDIRIVQTDEGQINGQDKCPKCGATDISLNTKKGMLRCNFCRHEFAPTKVQGLEKNIKNLEGQVVASGAQDIVRDVDSIITLK